MKSVAAGFLVLVVSGAAVSLYGYESYLGLVQENNSLKSQVATLNDSISAIETSFNSLGKNHNPPILLRTFGTALASYIERPDGTTYLRLTETGQTSGAEAALASTPFNATIAGNSIEWKAVANTVAADSEHTFWPMVLENSPSGDNAIEFEDSGGIQAVAVIRNGAMLSSRVEWDATVVNSFKIAVVSPGQQVNFYINGQLVKALTDGVPNVGFLLSAAEVKGTGAPVGGEGVATIDVYGGLLG